VSDLVQHCFDLAERRDRRYTHRWVVSRAHIQAFHDMLNAERAVQRQRLLDTAARLPGFDPAPHLQWTEPLPPPTFDNEYRLLGWPVRLDDVDEIGLEPVRRLSGFEIGTVDPWEESTNRANGAGDVY
jgi:hypothetical protein